MPREPSILGGLRGTQPPNLGYGLLSWAWGQQGKDSLGPVNKEPEPHTNLSLTKEPRGQTTEVVLPN